MLGHEGSSLTIPKYKMHQCPMKPQGRNGCPAQGNPTRGKKEPPHHGQIWNEGGYKKKISNNFRKGQGDGRPLEDAEVSWAPLKVSGTQGLGNGNEGIWFMTTVFTEPLSHATLFQEPQMF